MPNFKPHYPTLGLLLLIYALALPGGSASAGPTDTIMAQRAQWWSFQPVTHPTPPHPVDPDHWIRNPIDSFVLAHLQASKLLHSPPADRPTLIRRVTFDLTGLPPTPQEVADFVADASPDAYEKLVDRLLASPRYGECWARHWLDVVHYGDTHGYDKDKIRPNSWHYRDYVIDAFNRDLPYARFVKEQLAGDVLYPDDPSALLATGFIAAGPWDFVGHTEISEETDNGKLAAALDRDDMVINTMSTFTSLTVHCARCHDHKFDAITQQDYYSLQAVFAGVDRADRHYDADPAVAARRHSLTHERLAATARLSQIEQAVSAQHTPELAQLEAQIQSAAKLSGALTANTNPSPPTLGYHSAFAPSPDNVKWVQVDLGRSQPIDSVYVAPVWHDYGGWAGPGWGFPLRYKVEAGDDPRFAQNVATLVDCTQSDQPSPRDIPIALRAPAGLRARYVRMTATRLWHRNDTWIFALSELAVASGGQNIARGAAVTSLDTTEAAPAWGRVNLTDGHFARTTLDAVAGAGQSSNSLASLAAAIAAASDLQQAQAKRDALRENAVAPQLRDERAALIARVASIDGEIKSLPAQSTAYGIVGHFPTGTPDAPAGAGRSRPIHVLHRGSVTDEKEEVGPGSITAISLLNGRFTLLDENSEGQRRAALAQWIVDPKNPLTWRSIVNRVWQYHFGQGLVESTSDFGHMGSLPSDPQLLDSLASQFRDGPQSLKALHRLIVTSSTYRQSSASNAEGENADASNRLLWRMNRRRLDAEAIRDSVLCASGTLDLKMGGPGFYLFGFIDDHSPHYLYEQHDPDDPASLRRSIYRFVVRSVPDPFMTTLDCPDPSLVNDKRFETVTPLQSLAMLNDAFMVRQAQHFAERLQRSSADPNAQLDEAFQLALSRRPTDQERRVLLEYQKKNGLPNLCRLILNLNEFVFVD